MLVSVLILQDSNSQGSEKRAGWLFHIQAKAISFVELLAIASLPPLHFASQYANSTCVL
jgi:hypothetical protein